MDIRRRSRGGLCQDGVVVEENTRGAVCHPRRAAGRVVGDVSDPIDWPSNGGLIAKRVGSGIQHHVSHDADVVHAAIDLESIVVKVGHVVVVVIDRNGPPVPILFGRVVRTIERV